MILLTLVACSVQSAQAQRPIDFVSSWNSVASAIRNSYYGRTFSAEDLDSILRVGAVSAKKCNTETAFRAAVNTVATKFGGSHFELMTEEEQGYYLMDNLARLDARPLPNLDAWFEPDANGFAITMLLEGGQCDRAGLRKGDVVTRIGDRPFSPVDSLRDKVGQTVTLTVRRGQTSFKKQVAVQQDAALSMFMAATQRSERVISMKGKRIAYIHLWTLGDPKFREEMDRALSGPLGDADAVVLDIRDGFGGYANGYTDRFFLPDIRVQWGGKTERSGDSRPIALLINKGTVSAKEMIAYVFKKTKRATLFGSPTPGRLLAATGTRIGDWAWLETPGDQVKIDGICLEKNGVSPDVTVEPEYDANGNDRVLEAALEFLTKKG